MKVAVLMLAVCATVFDDCGNSFNKQPPQPQPEPAPCPAGQSQWDCEATIASSFPAHMGCNKWVRVCAANSPAAEMAATFQLQASKVPSSFTITDVLCGPTEPGAGPLPQDLPLCDFTLGAGGGSGAGGSTVGPTCTDSGGVCLSDQACCSGACLDTVCQ